MERGPVIIIAGVIAGVIGAAVWAGIAYGLNLEIGWIAWLIGGLIGFAVSAAGGQGGGAALLAAAITVLSICGGKIASVHFAVEKFKEELSTSISVEDYKEAKEDAALFAKLQSSDQYPAFMVERDYTDAERVEDLTQEEIAEFEADTVPMLKNLNANPPPFEQWKESLLLEMSTALSTQFTLWERLKSTLSLFDVIFFCLGVGTAFRIAHGSTEGEEA